jgi:hypothetical protein
MFTLGAVSIATADIATARAVVYHSFQFHHCLSFLPVLSLLLLPLPDTLPGQGMLRLPAALLMLLVLPPLLLWSLLLLLLLLLPPLLPTFSLSSIPTSVTLLIIKIKNRQEKTTG